MTHTCRCDREIQDTAVLCPTCTAKVQAALESIARQLPMLRVNAAQQGVSAQRTGRVGGTGHSDGVNVHALDVLAEVRGVVAGWLRIMVEENVVTTMPERLDNGFVDTANLCLHLASRMPLVRLHEAAGDVAGDVLDDDNPSIALAEEGSKIRPPLDELVRQVIDTHRDREKSFAAAAAAAGDRLSEAFERFMPVSLALRAVNEQGVRVSERQAQRWIAEQRLLVERRRRSMDADLEAFVMPSSLVELAATVKRGRPPSERRAG